MIVENNVFKVVVVNNADKDFQVIIKHQIGISLPWQTINFKKHFPRHSRLGIMNLIEGHNL